MSDTQSDAEPPHRSTPARGAAVWVAILVFVVLFAIALAAGLAVFRTYVANDVWGAASLTVVAVVAGVASFFNPCAFPLLPGYVALHHMPSDRGAAAAGGLPARRANTNAIAVAGAAAAGSLSFAVLLGALIAGTGAAAGSALSVTAEQPNVAVLVFRGVLSAVVLALGVTQLRGRSVAPLMAERIMARTIPQRRRSRLLTMYLYGFGYVAAGIGCTGPIVAGLIVLALRTAEAAAPARAFALFAATVSLLMFVTSLVAAGTRVAADASLYRFLPRIKQAGAVVLILAASINLLTTLMPNLLRSFVAA